MKIWIKSQKKSNKIDLSGVSHYCYVDEKGVYYPGNSANTSDGEYTYDIIHPITKKVCAKPQNGYRWPETTFWEANTKGDVLWGDNETSIPKIKKRLETATELLKSYYYEDNRSSTKELKNLMGEKIFDNPKSVKFIKKILRFTTKEDDLILDFFAGSSTTAHSIIDLNSEDGGNRHFIMVQLPENLDIMLGQSGIDKKQKSQTKQTIHYLTSIGKPHFLTEIGKERIRRAGQKIKEEAELQGQHLDIGFRVYKLDSSNLRVWNPKTDDQDPEADELKLMLESHEKHLLPGRTQEDLLYEILLKQGIELTEDARIRELGGKRVYSLGHGQYYACMETAITSDQIEPLALGIAQWKNEESPDNTQCAVFVIDEAFQSDADKLNFAKILEQHGIPSVKAL